uniref:Choline transporter-like protein n=1 Tax=Hirondellea gigas TaxID=1518452 RepID=A0A6A7G9N8_9CRUS
MKQCLPPVEVLTEAAGNGYGGQAESMANAMGDLMACAGLVAGGAAIAIVIAFLYVWFLRGFASCLVWTAITLTITGCALIGWALLQKAAELEATGASPDQAKAAKYMSYAIFGLTAIFTLVIIFLRKRIQIAVEVVKEAARAISDVKGTVFFPLITLSLGILYFVFWIWGAATIFSVEIPKTFPISPAVSQDIQRIYLLQKSENYQSVVDIITIPADTPPFDEYIEYSFDKSLQRPFAVFFFHLLWNIQFLIYFTFGVVSGAVADWYFTGRDTNGNKLRGSGEGELGRSPVLASCIRLMRYHLGTIMFGSFIIATIQFIRACVKYIEKTSKMKNNRLQKAIFCAIQCCLKILECCLDKLSKNAFIWNAIYGDAFCHSAVSSFKLLWRNLARVAAINMVAGYLLMIGKVVVAVFTAGIIGMILVTTEPYKTEVASPVFPVLVTLLLAYMIGSIFMVVYDTTIDTIFLCFLVDEENNKGGEMLASKSLQKVIGKYADASAKEAEKQKAPPGGGTTKA